MDEKRIGSNTFQKTVGYTFRMIAIVIWGLTSIFGRYLHNLPAEFILGFSLCIGAVFLLILQGARAAFRGIKGKSPDPISGPKKLHISFWIAILGDAFVVFSIFLAVKYTFASHVKLLLTFAPVAGLIIAYLFMEKKSAYFYDRKSVAGIFLIFLGGCLGAALLLYHSFDKQMTPHALLGDFIGFLAMIADVIATLAVIHYSKRPDSFSGFDYGLRKVCILALLLLPFTIYHAHFLSALTLHEWYVFVFLGTADMALSYILAYLAYQRLDGLIAYLLFNLSTLITIVLEIIFFDLPITSLFIVGGMCILASSVLAEIVNTKYEKKQRQTPRALSA